MAVNYKPITTFRTGVDSLDLFFGREVKMQLGHVRMKEFADQYPKQVRYDEASCSLHFEFDTGECIVVKYDYLHDELLFCASFKSYNPLFVLKQTGYLGTIEIALADIRSYVKKYFDGR